MIADKKLLEIMDKDELIDYITQLEDLSEVKDRLIDILDNIIEANKKVSELTESLYVETYNLVRSEDTEARFFRCIRENHAHEIDIIEKSKAAEREIMDLN